MKGRMKSIFGCLMAFTMVATTINLPQSVATVRAEGTCEHLDANDDNKCDKCGESFLFCGESAIYSLDESTGKLTISGKGSIDDEFFSLNSRLCELIKSVEIQDGITYLGKETFWGCSNLKDVTIPSSVTSIGLGVFDCCESLEDITIPSSVTEICDGAFFNCYSLETINIPSSVTSIGDKAFTNCYALKSINIPSGVMSIGEGTFDNCYALENITIPSSVTSIGKDAFISCNNLKNVYYAGTKDTWNKIAISDGNDNLKNATLITTNSVESASLALDGTLKVQIKFRLADITDCTINGKTFMVDANNCATIDVAPKNYDRDIVVVCGKGDDVYEKSFSVGDMLDIYKQPEDTTDIAYALELYCEAAKDYFAGEKVTNYSSHWNTVKTATSNHTVTMGDNYYGSSLVLNSGTILRHYYTDEFTGYTGTKNNMYYKDEMIPAHLYAKESVSEGTYCVNDYICRALNNESSTPDLKNLCVALYNYGVAAKAYSNAVANGGSN